MTILRFDSWEPDRPPLSGQGFSTLKNALPAPSGYRPAQALVTFTDAIAERARGGIEVFDIVNDPFQFVGDRIALYELQSNLTWADKSKTGGYSLGTNENWSFTRWQNKVLAAAFGENIQQLSLGGANFSDLVADLEARTIAVVGDFVVVGNTNDTTDGARANRIRWSAIGDETDWTVSSSTLSDFRDLPTGGPVRKVLGGDIGLIISDRAIFRMAFVGAPVVFQIDEVQNDFGSIIGNSAVKLGDVAYVLTSRGFWAITNSGTGVANIGGGRVNDFVDQDIDLEFAHRISVFADPINNQVAWAYPGIGHTGGRPNRIIIYDVGFDRWGLIEAEVDLLTQVRGFRLTLDDLDTNGFPDLDAMTISLDSVAFRGTAAKLAAFDSSLQMGAFEGTTLEAVLGTNEVQFQDGHQVQINAVAPLVDGGQPTLKIGRRDQQSEIVQFTPELSATSTGRFTARVNGRFHRFEMILPAGEAWRSVIGLDVETFNARPAGRRLRSL